MFRCIDTLYQHVNVVHAYLSVVVDEKEIFALSMPNAEIIATCKSQVSFTTNAFHISITRGNRLRFVIGRAVINYNHLSIVMVECQMVEQRTGVTQSIVVDGYDR